MEGVRIMSMLGMWRRDISLDKEKELRTPITVRSKISAFTVLRCLRSENFYFVCCPTVVRTIVSEV